MKQSNRSPPAWLTWNLHPSPNFQRSSHYAAARIPIPQPSHSLRAGVPASNPGRVPTLLQPLTLCRATPITIQRRRRSRSYLPPHSAIFPSRIKFDFHADTACCANNHPYRFHLAFSLLQPPRCLSRASCQSLLIERVNIAIIRAFWNGSLQNCRQSGGPAFLAPICCKSGALCSWSCVFRQVSMVMQWLKTPQSAINRMVNVHVYRGMLVFRSRAHLYNSLSEPQSTILTACTQTPRKKSSRPMKRPEVPTAPQ